LKIRQGPLQRRVAAARPQVSAPDPTVQARLRGSVAGIEDARLADALFRLGCEVARGGRLAGK
jgi:hypothetical protein